MDADSRAEELSSLELQFSAATTALDTTCHLIAGALDDLTVALRGANDRLAATVLDEDRQVEHAHLQAILAQQGEFFSIVIKTAEGMTDVAAKLRRGCSP